MNNELNDFLFQINFSSKFERVLDFDLELNWFFKRLLLNTNDIFSHRIQHSIQDHRRKKRQKSQPQKKVKKLDHMSSLHW